MAGMDPVCCESEEWMAALGVQDLTRGSSQPFYQVGTPRQAGSCAYVVQVVVHEGLTQDLWQCSLYHTFSVSCFKAVVIMVDLPARILHLTGLCVKPLCVPERPSNRPCDHQGLLKLVRSVKY